MERHTTTSEIVRAGADALRNSLYVAMPGSVVLYYPATQTADIQPMIQDPRFDLDTGAIVFEPWSIIKQVPICWPRMGGFTICGFLNPSDPVMLEAFDLDPGPWRAQGKSLLPTKPQDVRRLGGNYWRATPTDLTVDPIVSAPVSPGMVIGADGLPSQIVITPTKIQLGLLGGDFVALASKVDACMTAIKTHVHSGVTTGVGASGPSATLSSLPPTGSLLIAAQ